MKSILVACALFFLMIATIVGNALYVNKTVDGLLGALEATDPSESEQNARRLQELEALWEKEKKYVQVSVSHQKIDTVSDLLSSLLIYNKHHDLVEYEKTAALLSAAMEELRLPEKLSGENVF